jgi:hypothetical protein
MTPWTDDQAFRKAATCTGQHATETQASMSRMRFEPTIAVFERAKRLHVLDRAPTVIGALFSNPLNTCSSLGVNSLYQVS